MRLTDFYGNFIKEQREKQNLTINDLSRKSGIPRTTLRQWEMLRNIPTVDRFDEVLEALGVELILGKVKEDNA